MIAILPVLKIQAILYFIGFVDLMEFLRLPIGDMKLFLHKLGQENSFVQSRNSNQTWLWHYGAYNELLESFHER